MTAWFVAEQATDSVVRVAGCGRSTVKDRTARNIGDSSRDDAKRLPRSVIVHGLDHLHVASTVIGAAYGRSMTGWAEIATGVFRRRYQPMDVSVTVVRSEAGLLIIDTRSSHREADVVRADLRELGGLSVRWVVNTHAHYDHTFGNARFGLDSDVGAPIYAHERVPAHLDEFERPKLARWIADGRDPVEEWREVVITPPTVLIGDATTLDLGDRSVELVHLGRAHRQRPADPRTRRRRLDRR